MIQRLTAVCVDETNRGLVTTVVPILIRIGVVVAGLWSPEHGLFYRDETYFNKTTPSGQPIFWGRGNGWAAGE